MRLIMFCLIAYVYHTKDFLKKYRPLILRALGGSGANHIKRLTKKLTNDKILLDDTSSRRFYMVDLTHFKEIAAQMLTLSAELLRLVDTDENERAALIDRAKKTLAGI